MALSSPPFDQWYLAYVALVPLFLKTRNYSPVGKGIAYALCGSIIAANWWHSSIIFSALIFLLIVGILCSAFFIWGFLSAAFKPSKTHPFIALLAPGVIWVGIERILTSEWVGIPCNFGITQSSQPLLIQSASLFGIYASSFLIVVSNTALAIFVQHCRSRQTISTLHWMAFFSAVALMGLNIGYGFSKTYSPVLIENPVKVAVVQPMISSDLYRNGWRNPENRDFMKSTLDQLTAQAITTRPDILFWPEGGNGYLNMRIAELRDSLYQTAIRFNTDLLISSNDLDEQGKKYNSIFSISRKGELLGRYDKVNLIPIAEDSYSAGDDYHTIPSSFGKVGPVICYESNFPSPFRKVTAKGAELLFVSTSDAAFRKTSLTINHSRMAIFRAIENNRWVIHASNTGPSVIVSPTGQITASVPFYNRNFVTANVEFIQEMSFFTRFGYQVPVLFALLASVLFMTRIFQWVVRVRNAVRPVNAAEAPALMHPNSIKRHLKAWISLAGKCSPIMLFHGLLLISLIASSILLVNQQTTPENPAFYALSDVFSPTDTPAPDKVSQKFLQAKSNSCGPAVLAYVFSYFGKISLEDELIQQMTMTKKGASMLELKNIALQNEFQAIGVKENYQALMEEPLPVIAYINDSHYVVVNKITRYHVWVFDPAIGHVKLSRPLFEQAWNGYLLLIRMLPIQKSIVHAQRPLFLSTQPMPKF